MSRTYVITGSASGIGAATRRRVLDQGDRVIGIDLRDAEVRADLSTAAGRTDAVRDALGVAGGPIDAVIACAGISAPSPVTVAIDYFGVVDVLTGLLPALRESPTPRATVVSSMASLQPCDPALVDACLRGDESAALARGAALAEAGPEAGFLNYSSAKRALSRWVRRESVTPCWAGAGIPLNAVAPGTVVTPMTADLLADPATRAVVDASVPMPLNSHQRPEVVADLLVWLTSEQNSHCAGQTIYCDGGADAVLRGDDIWSWADAPSTSATAGPAS